MRVTSARGVEPLCAAAVVPPKARVTVQTRESSAVEAGSENAQPPVPPVVPEPPPPPGVAPVAQTSVLVPVCPACRREKRQGCHYSSLACE